jgi:hypothetical protein
MTRKLKESRSHYEQSDGTISTATHSGNPLIESHSVSAGVIKLTHCLTLSATLALARSGESKPLCGAPIPMRCRRAEASCPLSGAIFLHVELRPGRRPRIGSRTKPPFLGGRATLRQLSGVISSTLDSGLIRCPDDSRHSSRDPGRVSSISPSGSC